MGEKFGYLTLMNKHRLRVIENRVPRRIFGWKKDEVIEEWRKLHNEVVHNLQLDMDGECSMNGEKKTVYMTLVGEPEETTRKTKM
jgi:hypothetical protein